MISGRASQYIASLGLLAILLVCAVSNMLEHRCILNTKGHYFNDDFVDGILSSRSCSQFVGDSPELKAWAILNRARGGDGSVAIAEAIAFKATDAGAWADFAFAGANLFNKSNHSGALRSAETALKIEPRNENFAWVYAELLRVAGRYNEALRFVNHWAGTAKSPLMATERGSILADRAREAGFPHQQLATALKEFDVAQSLDPTWVRPTYLAGLNLASAGRWDEAARAFAGAASQTTSPKMHIRYWEAIVRASAPSDAQRRDIIVSDLSKLRTSDSLSSMILYEAVSSLNSIGAEQAAATLKKELLNTYPDSLEASQHDLNRLRLSASALQQERAPFGTRHKTLIRDFEALAARPAVQAQLIGDQSLYTALSLAEGTRNTPREIKKEIAERLAITTGDPITKALAAEGIVNAGGSLGLARRAIREGAALTPAFITRTGLSGIERDTLISQIRLKLLGAEAALLEATNQNNAAMATYLEASRQDKMIVEPYLRMGDLLHKMGSDASAVQEYEKCASLELPLKGVCYSRLVDLVKNSIAIDKKLIAVKQSMIVSERRLFSAPTSFSIAIGNGRLITERTVLGRPTILVFWGDWCAACKAEMPGLLRASNNEKNKDANVIFVSDAKTSDRSSPPLPLFPESVIWAKSPKTFSDFEVTSVPTIIFLDKQGRISFRLQGQQRAVEDEIALRVRQLL